MKKTKQQLLMIIILIILMSIVMFLPGKTLYYTTNNISFFLMSMVEQSIILTLMIGVIIVLILPIIILRKSEETQLNKKHIKIIVLIMFIALLLCLNYTDTYEKYKIENKKIYGIEMFFRTLGDIITNQTIDIEADSVEVIYDLRYRHGGRHGSSGTEKYYYLSINEQEHIIPIGNIDKVNALLYKSTYGNTITVYQNSKLIKAINGIELSNDDEIYDFLANKQYKINISLQTENTITYKTIGVASTIEEFMRNEKIYLCIFDENNNVVLWDKINNKTDELPIDLDNGKYKAYVCTMHLDWERISNGITYKIKNGKIVEIKEN